MKKIFEWIGLFEASLSVAEWVWRIITIVIIAGGGTITGLTARSSTLFQSAGPVAWIGIGLLAALLVSVILFLAKRANKLSAEADYTRALAAIARATNPLLESFSDQIIKLEDLRLPGKQLHKNKLFKRCKLVGPGAIAILGGTYDHCDFIECGDIVVLPDKAYLTGIIAFENCTVEECEFYRITVFTTAQAGKEFKKMGVNVVGLPAE